MASSSSSGGDRDDALDEDMEALRRACVIAGADPSALASDSDGESDSTADSGGSDDLALLRRIQERFPSVAASPVIRPLSSHRPMDSDDEEDDLAILRTIQRRFSQYENENMKRKSENSVQESDAVVDETSELGTPNTLSKSRATSGGTVVAQGGTNVDFVSTELHREEPEDETSNLPSRPFIYSQFPKSAQNFVDALKKNRSCQKFIRRKLIEIEAKIEGNKDLKERIKCLMDFQLDCKRKLGQALCQKADPRIRLIFMQTKKISKSRKTSSKKVPALSLGPAENSHVCKYRMVMRRFPVSLHKLPWSKIEKEKLMRGIKQQFQEMMILNSMNFESDADGSVDPELMLALSSSGLQVTSEVIRSFLPLVNWDRLASMYLPGRSGAECEARWLNCEDPMINQSPWTILEDKRLLFIVQERGLYNWIDIAITLGTHRTPFQCLARYQRSLNPHILNKDWTDDEDAKLRAAVETFGDNNWQLVSSNLEGRTGPQCSNRWRKSLNPDRKKVGRWSIGEDKFLKVAVMLFGVKNWNKIAQFVPGRTQVQCRERWLNCLDPSLNLEAWTEEEDAKLLAAIEEHGYSWSKVATCVPPRTDNQCRRRWKVLLPHEVPLLQAARQMKRTVLISNFVDRESERPSIGPNDFSPLVTLENDVGRNKNKKSRDNHLMKSRAEFHGSLGENPIVDHMEESCPGNTPAGLALVPVMTSSLTEGESLGRKRKRASAINSSKRPRVKSKRALAKETLVDSMINSSAVATIDHSLPISAKSNSGESQSSTRARKKSSSNNRPKQSRVMRSHTETPVPVSMANTSEVSPVSLVPTACSNTTEIGNISHTRKKKLSDNQPQRSRIKSRALNDEKITVPMEKSCAEVAPQETSCSTCNTGKSGSNRKRRKKTSSGDQQLMYCKKSTSRNRGSCGESNGQYSIVDHRTTENFPIDVPLSEWKSAAAENSRNRKIKKW